MKNIAIKVVKNIMTITVDLKKEFGPSKSGKTIIIGSTEGNQTVAPNVVLGMNVYKYPDK